MLLDPEAAREEAIGAVDEHRHEKEPQCDGDRARFDRHHHEKRQHGTDRGVNVHQSRGEAAP